MISRPALPARTWGNQVEEIMQTQKFDIFSGRYSENDACWIDAVVGFEEAYQMMLTWAAFKPGPYFIYDSGDAACVGNIDTSYVN